MKLPVITLDSARKVAVGAQLLDGQTALPDGQESIEKIIGQLGYIQIDTISVVNRSHHHTLWTRSGQYSEDYLHCLQSKDRKIFEYWGHAMSYLPMSDFRYSLPRMKSFFDPKSAWAKHQIEKTRGIIGDVLKRVRDEGPLGARDFESEPEKKGGPWWDWKPAKMALELLFWRGELMISERRNFQKIYDLTERVLPGNTDTSIPQAEETARFIATRVLKAFGIVSEKEAGRFLQPEASRDADMQMADRGSICKILEEMAEAGDAIKVRIEGIPTDYYLHPGYSALIGQPGNSLPAAKLISPFDNLIIQRERAQQLFNFNYSLECYTPEAKRKYGYFVFPVLWGHNLVGRFDPKSDRKNKILQTNSLYFEPGFSDFENFLPAFAAELNRMARFNGCEKVAIGKAENTTIKKKLELLLKKG